MRAWRKKTSLRDLSARLNLSMTTVSRALNGYSDVSAKTRERVLRTARELGYTPNAQARRLTSGSTEAIGFVMSDVDAYFGDPYFAELLAGLTDVFNGADLDLVIACAHAPDDQLTTYQRLVEARRVDGLILDRTRMNDARVDYLLAQGFPFVAFGQTDRKAEHAFLDFDGEQAFAAVANRLIELGHRRIAMIGAEPSYNFVRLRRLGYERALRAAGLAVDPSLYLPDGFSLDAGARSTAALLGRPRPPTAIMCIDDSTAIGVVDALRRRGLRAGKDISVTGYNDIASARLCDPPLTTVAMPARRAGRKLAEMLLEILHGTPPSELQEIWMPELVVRGSDGPPPMMNIKEHQAAL